jgi:hypothetical protein
MVLADFILVRRTGQCCILAHVHSSRLWVEIETELTYYIKYASYQRGGQCCVLAHVHVHGSSLWVEIKTELTYFIKYASYQRQPPVG